MSIGKLLSMGKGALAANQTALSTTSHNIANASTKGYSRQWVEMSAEAPTSMGIHQLGGGVKIGAVQRVHSDFLNRRIEQENSNLGHAEGVSDTLQQIESSFKDDSEQGISKAVSQFFNDVRTLSTQPESAPLRSAVRESANAITARFRSVSENVSSVVTDIDRRIEGSVTEVNSLIGKIADLNRRIAEVEIRGSSTSANDERDQRDVAIQDLAKLLPISVSETENGGVNVVSDRAGILVNAADAFELKAIRTGNEANPGSVQIFTTDINGKPSTDVTASIDAGAIGGYVNVRDRVVPGLRDKLDRLAYALSTNVNSVHRQAFGADGKDGHNFFHEPNSVRGAAANLSLSSEVMRDPNKISAGFVPNSPGDNRALLAMADLQDAKVLDGGNANFVDYTASIIGELGVQTRGANENFEVQKGLVDQLGVMREQVSGVSLDEEAIHMIQYQKAFDASAKMIQVADQMYDTVLSLKRF